MTETRSECELYPMMVYGHPPPREEYPSDLEKDPQECLLITGVGNTLKEEQKILPESETKILDAKARLKLVCFLLKFISACSILLFVIIFGSELWLYLSMPSCRGYHEYLSKPSSREMLFYGFCGVCSILMIPLQIALVRLFLQAIQEKNIEKSDLVRWIAIGCGVLSLANEIMVIGGEYPSNTMKYCGGLLYNDLLGQLVIFQVVIGFFLIPIVPIACVFKRDLILVQNSEQKPELEVSEEMPSCDNIVYFFKVLKATCCNSEF